MSRHVFRVCILRQRSKHRSVFHLMSIDHRIVITEIRTRLCFCINRSRQSLGSLNGMVQIIQIVSDPLDDRIINLRVRDLNPRINLRIFLLQRCKVNRNFRLFHLFFRLFFRNRCAFRCRLCRFFRGGGCAFCYMCFLCNVFIRFLSLPQLYGVSDSKRNGAEKNDQKYVKALSSSVLHFQPFLLFSFLDLRLFPKSGTTTSVFSPR